MDVTKGKSVMSNQEWTHSRLGEYFQIKHGFAFKSKFFAEEGQCIVLTPGNFNADGGIKLKGDKEKYYTGDFPDEYLLKQGELLVVMTDLTQNAPILGSPAFIPESGRFLHNQRLGKVVDLDKSRMDRAFLYYLFNSYPVRAQIKASATGATVRHTAPSRIYDVEVDVPPLAIQRTIAAVLSAYDDLIENNTRRIAILEEMARLIYREWFVHYRFPGHEEVEMVESELGPIPEGWKIGRLDDALLLQRGFDLPRRKRQQGNVPVYAATGITDTHNEAKVKAPGVVTGRSGSLGTVMYVEEDFWPLNTTLWVREFRRVTPLYAYYLLNGLRLENYNSGAAVPTLNRNDVHGLPVILPPEGVLKQFNECVLELFAVRKNLHERNIALRRIRDMLLPRLISGEIDVSDLDIAL